MEVSLLCKAGLHEDCAGAGVLYNPNPRPGYGKDLLPCICECHYKSQCECGMTCPCHHENDYPMGGSWQ